MVFKSIGSGNLLKEYEVILGADEIEGEIDKAVNEQRKTFKRPGFRVGHVPYNVVRQTVEPGVVQNVLNDLANRACTKISTEEKIGNLISRPLYRFSKEYEKNSDMEMRLVFELAPVFELKPIDVEIERVIPKVSDKEVEEEKERLMKAFPMRKPAEKNHKIQAMDEVLFGAMRIEENGDKKNDRDFENTIVIPEDIQDDEFLKMFIGKKLEEEFEFTPPNEGGAKYKVVIKAIKAVDEKPSMEEYAKHLGLKDVDELNKSVREKLCHEIDDLAFWYHKSQILKSMEKQYDFELPQRIVDIEMSNIIHDMRTNEPEEVEGKTDEELRKEYESIVKTRVTLGYVLNKMAQEEAIVVTDRDVQNAIAQEITENPDERNEIIEYYTRDQNAVIFKRAEIVEERVINHVMTKAAGAKMKDVEMTKSEIEKIYDGLMEE